MTNLEKFTAGEVLAEHNGTLDQLSDVLKYSFPNDDEVLHGIFKFYGRKKEANEWDCWNKNHKDLPTLPTIPITQLWEELQALKKPEIVLPEKWGGEIEGLPAPILKRMMECQVEQGNKADHTVFEEKIWAGKEFRGMEWEKTKEGLAFWEQVLENKSYSKFFEMYPETKPEKVEKSLEEKISELKKLIDHRGCLLIQFDVLNDEINGIETKISALLK